MVIQEGLGTEHGQDRKPQWMILPERGTDTTTLKADNMRIILLNHEGFATEKLEVE